MREYDARTHLCGRCWRQVWALNDDFINVMGFGYDRIKIEDVLSMIDEILIDHDLKIEIQIQSTWTLRHSLYTKQSRSDLKYVSKAHVDFGQVSAISLSLAVMIDVTKLCLGFRRCDQESTDIKTEAYAFLFDDRGIVFGEFVRRYHCGNVAFCFEKNFLPEQP